jgi:hypothetical protein
MNTLEVGEGRTVSASYTLAELVAHPATRLIVLRHLEPLGLEEEQLRSVRGTLAAMFSYNMGGGIPSGVITGLVSELDSLGYPLPTHEEGARS